MPTTRRTLVGLHLFDALSAVGGGIALIAGGLGVPTTSGSIVVMASIRLSQETTCPPEPQTVFAARNDQQVLR